MMADIAVGTTPRSRPPPPRRPNGATVRRDAVRPDHGVRSRQLYRPIDPQSRRSVHVPPFLGRHRAHQTHGRLSCRINTRRAPSSSTVNEIFDWCSRRRERRSAVASGQCPATSTPRRGRRFEERYKRKPTYTTPTRSFVRVGPPGHLKARDDRRAWRAAPWASPRLYDRRRCRDAGGRSPVAASADRGSSHQGWPEKAKSRCGRPCRGTRSSRA